MTIREMSEKTGIAYRTICKYAQQAGWTQNGKRTELSDEQVTLLLEAVKQGNNNQFALASSLQGMETPMTLELEIALAEKTAKELWKRKAERLEQKVNQLECRLGQTEQTLGQEVVAHDRTRRGLEMYQRIAEKAGAVRTDREDMMDTYRREK